MAPLGMMEQIIVNLGRLAPFDPMKVFPAASKLARKNRNMNDLHCGLSDKLNYVNPYTHPGLSTKKNPGLST
jgi:hypothetical protein